MSSPRLKPFYKTSRLGRLYFGKCEEVLTRSPLTRYKGKVQLIFTSPPFPLNRKKKYGNEQGEAFVKWLSDFAPLFASYLKPRGSIVMEMGNAWEPGRPIQSILALQSLMGFLQNKTAGLRLCQEFIYYNPARLPAPAEWVTVQRIRVKDSFTRLWWMSTSDFPKANNKRVLQPYSDAMKKLLEKRSYNAGKRPSEYSIGAESFFTNNGGSIPPNVLQHSNTLAFDPYLDHCRKNNIKPHPARMPLQVPEFFINFLTTEDDLVLDPFGGSNTTGAVAERLKRRWISIEAQDEYARASAARFTNTSSLPPPPKVDNEHARTAELATTGNNL